MRVQFLRRCKLGKGSTNGIVQYLQEYGTEDVEVIRNDIREATAPIVVRWGCTGNTPSGATVVQPASGIHNVCRKDTFRKVLQDAGVSVPASYFNKYDAILAIQRGESLIGRRSNHSQGRHAIVSRNIEEIRADNTSAYWSLIIPKQQEFRVYCFFGAVIAVAEKVPTNPSALLWNKAQGGSTFNNVRWSNWPISVVKEALKVHALSGCDFEGVDVMLHDGVPYILESNSAPSLTTEYRKQCFAKAFASIIAHIREHGSKPEHLVCNMGKRSYSHFIHPAINV